MIQEKKPFKAKFMDPGTSEEDRSQKLKVQSSTRAFGSGVLKKYESLHFG